VNLLVFIERVGSPPGRRVRSIVEVDTFDGADYVLREVSGLSVK